jgi:hypothetical protein
VQVFADRAYPISLFMADFTTLFTNIKTKKPRKACLYTVPERKSFEIHKKEYISQVTKQSRGFIFRSKILPDIFNYWTECEGLKFDEKEVAERVQVCGDNEE